MSIAPLTKNFLENAIHGLSRDPQTQRDPVTTCRSDLWSYLERLHSFRLALSFRIQPLFRINKLPPEMRPFAEFFSDLHFMLTAYPKIRKRIGHLVTSAAYLNHEGKTPMRVQNRLLVTNVIKYLISKDGLGFKPTLNNSVLGSLILYNLLKEAGLCPHLVKTVDSKEPRFCVSVVIDPNHPKKPTVIDLTRLTDHGVTYTSVIDYYDEIVTLQTKPIRISNLLRRIQRFYEHPESRI